MTREPVPWRLDDLALMAGAIVPTIFASTFLIRALKAILPSLFALRVVEVFCYQTAFYVFTLLALYFIVAIKHHQPFLEALAWTPRFSGAMWCVALGPVLVVLTPAIRCRHKCGCVTAASAYGVGGR